ncbi:hypothetical protein MKZ38_002114 [Zalerion maritima]|uniref:Uncharacterized protein n=1 Tax=Zalerion maritima TaxID=339359 RepID=A0AAD5RWJ3_9PEZI|nr:hypothetical protein MKZ38_002114 [Zalerion maritima]
MPESPRRTGSSSIFTIPSPLRQLFSHFPLVTYAASELPVRCPDEESRTKNTLHVFSSPTDAPRGLPSYNPTCLKWQVFLRLAGIEFETVASNNHASPTGVLPFLLPRAPTAAIEAAREPEEKGTELGRIPLHHRAVLPVASGKLEEFGLSYDGGAGGKRVGDVEGVMRAEVYQSLLDTRIRCAWLHSLYLAPENTELLGRLYVNPISRSYVARASTLHSLRRAAEAEILRATGTAVIDAGAIYAAADEAFEALSTVLGEDDWFFGSEKGTDTKAGGEGATEKEVDPRSKPSLFDAAVFSYTHLLLDGDMAWQDRRLAELAAQSPALVRHRDRILDICWSEPVK